MHTVVLYNVAPMMACVFKWLFVSNAPLRYIMMMFSSSIKIRRIRKNSDRTRRNVNSSLFFLVVCFSSKDYDYYACKRDLSQHNVRTRVEKIDCIEGNSIILLLRNYLAFKCSQNAHSALKNALYASSILPQS